MPVGPHSAVVATCTHASVTGLRLAPQKNSMGHTMSATLEREENKEDEDDGHVMVK